MPSETEVAVLFADVVGSTELYEALGDLKARDTIAHCLEAMKGATDAAGRMQKDLKKIYNRARQESITKELLDIVGGASAVS